MDGLEAELDALECILHGHKEPDSLGLQLLLRVTKNFSDDRRIGEGGCGEVYKGILPNGEVIAVKKLKNNYQIVDDMTFLREVDSMIKVRHQNIVRFLGYCSEIKHKAFQMGGRTVMAEERATLLCFQNISNGSLDKYLADELRGLEWHTRYQIVRGICEGLLHLHNEKGIVHMDLKPANILLDDQMVPKITDFGLSRIDGKTQITSGQRLFSPWYAAAEYINTGQRSFKSDIYSLGVIIIELVTGSREMPNTTKVLRRWRHRWNKSSNHTPLWYLQVKKCLDLAVSCKEENPVNRPFIVDIVHDLNNIDSWDGQIIDSSLEKIVSSSDDMLGIEPLELHFALAHKKQISCSIELTNDTYHYMAFRVVTTSVLPFSIHPNKDIAAPRSSCRITITLPAQDMAKLQNHCKLKESIVVQSTRIDGNLKDVDVTVDMFYEEGSHYSKNNNNVVDDKVVDQVNLTILFDILHEEHQKDVANLTAEMESLGTLSQLNDMAERLPPDQGAYDGSEAKRAHAPNGIHQPPNKSISAVSKPSLNIGRSLHPNGISNQLRSPGSISENSEASAHTHGHGVPGSPDAENPNRRGHSSSDDMLSVASGRTDDSNSKDGRSLSNGEDGYKSQIEVSLPSNQVQAEWIERYEPGVYFALVSLGDGTRDLKRVRFSRRRFGELQAENWWNENRDKVYERYNIRRSE